MELDDLRRQWRQAEPAPLPLPELHLPGRLPSATLTGQMRRNAWVELISSFVFAALPLLALPRAGSGFRALYVGVMVALLTTLCLLYARQLRLLRQMEQAEASIRGHLAVLCAGLRQQLRLYYLLMLWTGPLTLALLLGYYVTRELARPAGPRWLEISLVAAAVLGLGVLFQFGISRFTRWYVQRLYGQHLDRLEGQLRELDEPPAE